MSHPGCATSQLLEQAGWGDRVLLPTAGCVRAAGLSFLRRARRSQPSGKCFAITFFRESQQLTALVLRN